MDMSRRRGSGLGRGTAGFCWEQIDMPELQRLGTILDQRPGSLRGLTVGTAVAAQLLRVRTREGRTAALKANAAQKEFERRRGAHNIVLKARQMGLTTWAAARFFSRRLRIRER